MISRYYVTVGAGTSAGGSVIGGSSTETIDGAHVACVGDPVSCPRCHTTGVIEADGPRLSARFDGREMALGDDLCRCKCDPPPRLVANQTMKRQLIDGDWIAASAGAAVAQAGRLNAGSNGGVPSAAEGVPLVLLDPETHEPLRHRRYRLEHGDRTIEGTTDVNGATRPLTAAERASFIQWHVDEPGA